MKNDPYVGWACALRNWLLMTEFLIVGALVWQTPLAAQMDSEKRGSDNLTVVAHLPLGGAVCYAGFLEILVTLVEPLKIDPLQAIGHQALLGALIHFQIIMAND